MFMVIRLGYLTIVLNCRRFILRYRWEAPYAGTDAPPGAVVRLSQLARSTPGVGRAWSPSLP